MNLCFALTLSIVFSSHAMAETKAPWFGSEASLPEQISIDPLMVSSASSGGNTTIAQSDQSPCPIEGCPFDQKIGKQPK